MRRKQEKSLSLNRTACGFTEKQDDVGPCSYTPNITITKRRSPALIKYSLPKDQGVVKRFQSYIDNAQKKNERKNLEEIGRNTTSIAGGSCSFMSKVKKEIMTFDHGIPGPGFYYTEDPARQYKGMRFAMAKKAMKLVNYNNALLVQTQHEVTPGVGTYYKKSVQYSNPTNTFQCFFYNQV
jgi:hypothetical protein